MHRAQRILLAITCVLCIALFKRLWDIDSIEQSIKAFSKAGSEAWARSYAYLDSDGSVLDHSTRLRCAEYQGLEDLAIILKTGSTEIYEKLPIHLGTTFDCVKDHLIYSDVQQDLAGATIRDALALTSDHARTEREQLKQYHTLNEYFNLGGDAADLKGDKSWQLDKWKFLPMMRDAHLTFSGRKKWYFFIEADTYVSLHNLLPWIAKLDHKQAIYAGAQVMIGDHEFGHGGSGWLLSSTAAEAISKTYHGNLSHWENLVDNDCCGDLIMAKVFLGADPPIHLLRSFPLIQGETVTSLDWSATHWCKPAVTWHHVDAADIDRLWQFERRWSVTYGVKKPILFKDYYHAFIHPRLLATNGSLPGWDNLSNDWKFPDSNEQKDIDGHPMMDSEDACRRFCEGQDECLQWSWRPGSCKAGKRVRLGWALENRPHLGSAEDRIEKTEGKSLEGAVSGWMMDRIEKFRTGMKSCDEADMWPTENRR
ncbi:hypothetical protein Q7P37_002309 [Cladosporium fusiforme]